MATFKVRLPVANIFKFTADGRDTDERVAYDQQRYADLKHASMDERTYFQLYEKERPFKIQAYTNFPAMWVDLINCEGSVFQSIDGSKIKEYRNKNFYSSCKLISKDGKMFVYFMNEATYSDSDWETVTGQMGYAGKLPAINAVVGDQVRFEMAGNEYSSTITSIGFNPALQAEGYVLDFDVTLVETVDGFADVSYDAKPVDLFEVNGNLSLVANGLAFVRLRFGLSLSGTASTRPFIASFTSEPLDVAVKHQDALPINYRHNGEYTEPDVWSFEYPPNWYSTLMVPANMYQIITAGEIEADVNDTGVQRKTRAIPYRQLQLSILNIPNWILDKLMVVFSHDELMVNENTWEIENYGSAEGIQQVDLTTLNINMRQKGDRTVYETEFDENLTAEFVPDEGSIPYTAEEIEVQFNTNSGQPFSIINLPAWVSIVGDNLFEDGDTVTLSIEENDTLIARNVVLRARSEAFGSSLEAVLNISQAINDVDPPEEFLEVTADGVGFTYIGGTVDIGVSASSEWEIGGSTGYAFTYTKVNSTTFRIIAPANEGFSDRDATVTLWLASNHTVTKVITVEQLHAAIIEAAVAGGGGVVPMDGGILPIMVTCTNSSVQWQASIPNPFDADWLSISTSIKNGSQSINVTAHHNPLGYSRSGTVVFTNVNIPGNTIGVTISQNAE